MPIVVSNNAGLAASGPANGAFTLVPVTGGVRAVYDAVSHMLQNGRRLVSSPLPANVPLIRSPIRSIIVEESDRRYDTEGLIALEKARERTEVLGENTDKRVRDDLETIDRDQLLRALRQLEEFNRTV